MFNKNGGNPFTGPDIDNSGRFSFDRVIENARRAASQIGLDRYVATPADAVQLSYLRWLESGDHEQQEQYQVYRRYYEGDHPTQLTDRMREFLQLEGNITFRLNACAVPVDVLKERLIVTGFDSEDEALAEFLVGLIDHARLDALQDDVHLCAIRDGDTYVLVEPDVDGMPGFSNEMAFDGDQGMRIVYSNERAGRVLYAVKRWKVDLGDGAGLRERANIYWPDRIEKYISDTRAGEWLQFIEEDGGAWPIPWVDSAGKPLGVPVIHFAYNPGGYDFGKSRLHDVIPLQDAMNKAVIDAIAVADVEAFRLLYMTGGNPGDMEVAPGSFMYHEDPEVTFGVIPAGDLDKVNALVDSWIMRVAQISRTPLSYFQVTGQVASSDTQKADDKGLVSISRNTATKFGNAWEDAAHMAVKVYNTYGDGGLNEDSAISTVWDDFEIVDVLADEARRSAVVNQLVTAGATLEGALRVAGYTEEQISDLLTGSADNIL